MKTFTSYEELKESDNYTYKVLASISNCPCYSIPKGDMKYGSGGWFIAVNPSFVTDKQWSFFANRIIAYKNLQNLTFKEVIDGFFYEQEKISVDGVTFFVPTGNICGWMQGMFMCVDKDGNVNT